MGQPRFEGGKLGLCGEGVHARLDGVHARREPAFETGDCRVEVGSGGVHARLDGVHARREPAFETGGSRVEVGSGGVHARREPAFETGDCRVEVGSGGVHACREPAFETGGSRVEVGFGHARFPVGTDRIAHHRDGGFRLVFVEAGIAKALRGGIGVESHGAHDVTLPVFMAGGSATGGPGLANLPHSGSPVARWCRQRWLARVRA